MSEHEKESHWEGLASELGAAPSETEPIDGQLPQEQAEEITGRIRRGSLLGEYARALGRGLG